MSRDLVDGAVESIFSRIISGEFSPEEALPGEVELAALLEVSRLTMREAVKVLRDRGVLRAIQGRGTYVAPSSEWTDLGSLIRYFVSTGSTREVGLQVVEVRRMVEVGAAGLAAARRTEEDLRIMEDSLDALEAGGVSGDVDAVVQADLAFHQAIMRASANPFIPAIMGPLEYALRESRRWTSSHEDVRGRALMHHREIFAAIRDQDEQAAKDAMRSHMSQTRQDMVRSTN